MNDQLKYLMIRSCGIAFSAMHPMPVMKPGQATTAPRAEFMKDLVVQPAMNCTAIIQKTAANHVIRPFRTANSM